MDITQKRRMLELAGMSGVVLTESKKIVKESLTDEHGSLGTFVEEVMAHFQEMSTDSDYASEIGEEGLTLDSIEAYVKDMVDDRLNEIFSSSAFQQLVSQVSGQSMQVQAEPDQGILPV
jgi:hypothetical protein